MHFKCFKTGAGTDAPKRGTCPEPGLGTILLGTLWFGTHMVWGPLAWDHGLGLGPLGPYMAWDHMAWGPMAWDPYMAWDRMTL